MSNKLLKLSLIISISGILFLLFLSSNLQPIQVSSYSELTKLKPNSLVQTTGKIISVYSDNDFHIIKLDNNITLTFNHNLTPPKNQTITATGKLTTYKNQLQIQAETIKIEE